MFKKIIKWKYQCFLYKIFKGKFFNEEKKKKKFLFNINNCNNLK